LRSVWLADAAGELRLGVETLIHKLVAGELHAIGREHREGLPQSIPREHFAVPLRPIPNETIGPDELAALIQLGYVPKGTTNLSAAIKWVDPDDPDFDPARPATCLDIEGNTIYADSLPRWTDIQIIVDRESSRASPPKKTVSLDTYKNYQERTKEKTGHWSSGAEDETWAKDNGYSVESVREARTLFTEGLPEADRPKRGRRKNGKPAH
jgi:hypothetical protein